MALFYVHRFTDGTIVRFSDHEIIDVGIVKDNGQRMWQTVEYQEEVKTKN